MDQRSKEQRTENQQKLENLLMKYIEREIKKSKPAKILPAVINELTFFWRITEK